MNDRAMAVSREERAGRPMPSLSTFVVTAYDADADTLVSKTYLAHMPEVVGNVLRLVEFIIDPAIGPRERTVLAQWMREGDYFNEQPLAAYPSLLTTN